MKRLIGTGRWHKEGSLQLPIDAAMIPGVKHRNSAVRIPYNLHDWFNLTAPTMPTDGVAFAKMIYQSKAFKDGVDEIVLPHQWQLTEAALGKEGVNTWCAAGGGKTLVGLARLASAGRLPKLVVCPKKAILSWQDDIRKFSNFKDITLSGRTAVDFEPDPRYIYLCPYSVLVNWVDVLIKRFYTVVFDEVHYLKSRTRGKYHYEHGQKIWVPAENTATAGAKLGYAMKRRMGLTATQIPDKLIDMWGQLDAIEPYQWGRPHGFGVRYCAGHKEQYGFKYDGSSNLTELRSRLHWSGLYIPPEEVRRHLPGMRRSLIRIPVEDQDRGEMMKKEIAQAKKVSRSSYFEAMLMQAATKKRGYTVQRVIDALNEGKKVVVFTGRRKDCEMIATRIMKHKKLGNADVWWSHGGASSVHAGKSCRREIKDAYMGSAGPACLVATGQAWGESLNLQDTDVAFFTMMPLTPRNIEQWEGRFPRLGQVRPVEIIYISAVGTFDDHLAELLVEKLPVVGEVRGDEFIKQMYRDLTGASEGKESLLDKLMARLA